MRSEDLVAGLRDPAAYSHAFTGEVQVRETHISWLFFAGARVLKVKKPVDLGFLDFTTLERRRFFCEEEVRLNRRLAPGVYLGVAPIAVAEGGGLLVGLEPAVEVGVLMRRLPAERMLAALLERGEVDNATIAALVDVLVRFHAAAATGKGVDEHGSPQAVQRNVLENFEQTRPFTAAQGAEASSGLRVFPAGLHTFLEQRSREFLEHHRPLLEQRVAAGRIRDGHGDLHAENVCFLKERGGRVVAYDCIEFAPRLRCGDVACDLAFLAMDLDARGFRGFSAFLSRSYAERSRDAGIDELLSFYKGYRALVRAKVAGLRALGARGEARATARLEALRYLGLAASYELAPALILTCGLPASGKTWAARAVARPFEAPVFSSDVRRKLLHGVPLTEHRGQALGQGLYAPQATQRTYVSLLEEAAKALEQGRTVVVDATFPTRALRAPFVELAHRRDVPLLVVWPEADEATARARLAERARDPDAISDADLAVWLRARERFESPDPSQGGELASQEILRHASGALAPEELAALAVERLALRCEHRRAGLRS